MTTQLTCPFCGTMTSANPPDDACVFFFECPRCKGIIRPKAGDCCVFCSYGDHQCPPRIADIRRAKPDSECRDT